jgi:23S rRNA (uracil1939-C5)-methyltransferase
VRLRIDDVAFGGKGVARHEGKVVFVPFTIAGEEVEAHIAKEKKKFAEAALLTVHKTSADRVTPRCAYFQQCGGCSYQHIAYPRQLEIKTRQVEQTLQRVGKLQDVPMQPIIASPQPYAYRNRIRVHVADGIVGFYAHDRHELIDIESCPIALKAVNQALRDLRARPVRDGDYTLSGPSGTQVFSQVNEAVAQRMLELVAHSLAAGRSLLVDAYCGSGMFAKFLAPHFEHIIGIDDNEFAIERARRGAGEAENYITGDVGDSLAPVLQGRDPASTTVVLDPPATGVSARVCDVLLAAMPGEVFYVSCNPATLARDLAILTPSFSLKAVTPLDMFPQTAEIEVVTHLRAV